MFSSYLSKKFIFLIKIKKNIIVLLNQLLNSFKIIFLREKMLGLLFGGGLFFVLVSTGLFFWKIKPTDQNVILHYNSYFGIDVFGFDLEKNYFQVFLAMIGSLLIWLINFSLTALLMLMYLKNNLLEREEKKESGLFKKEVMSISKNENKFIFEYLISYILATVSLIVGIANFIYALAIILIND